MARLKIRFLLAATLAISSGGLFLAAAAPAAPAAAAPAAAGGTECIAHVANYAKDIEYAPGCTGHDEPELDPVSSLPGSAKDLTWTAVLPKDGRLPVSDVGPTFWWGGTVTDPNPQAICPSIKKAVAAGIPVVMFNAGVDNWQQCGGMEYFGQDETIAGVAAGKRLASEGAKKVLCVLQAQGQVQLEARCSGVKQGLGSKGTMEKLYVDGTNNSAVLSGITAKLRQDKSIDHVLTLGAPIALIALQSVSQANSDAKVVTFDTNPALVAKIKSGQVLWAVDQQPFLQGYLSIDSLWLFKTNANTLGGGQTVLTGPSFIDSSNIAKVAVFAQRGTR